MSGLLADRRGFGLVIAIWALALLGFLAASFGTTARTETTLARNALDQARARALADGAVHLAAQALADPQSRGRIRIDGSPATLQVDGEAVEVRITDEGGKIDLNEAPTALIAGLLRVLGAPQGRAEAIAAEVQRRREQPDRREAMAFRVIAEFASFPGMTPRLFDAAAPFITVSARQPGIDPWVAPAAVMAALPGFDAKEAARFVRDRPPALLGMDGPPLGLRGLEAYVFPSPGAGFGIEARVSSGSVTFLRRAVVTLHGSETRKPLIAAWR